MLRLIVTANIPPSSLILLTLMMETIRSTETSVLTRDTGHHIPEDGILHIHRLENLLSYMYRRVFQNWMLRRIREPKRDGVTGGWRKLHNEKLHNLFYSSYIVIKSRAVR
jgi:hypothetical protein